MSAAHRAAKRNEALIAEIIATLKVERMHVGEAVDAEERDDVVKSVRFRLRGALSRQRFYAKTLAPGL
jgi:hypothetical protein